MHKWELLSRITKAGLVAAEWIRAGCVALGVGSNLTGGAKTGDYGRITETARQFLGRINEARDSGVCRGGELLETLDSR
jgi:hypothetical protein